MTIISGVSNREDFWCSNSEDVRLTIEWKRLAGVTPKNPVQVTWRQNPGKFISIYLYQQDICYKRQKTSLIFQHLKNAAFSEIVCKRSDGHDFTETYILITTTNALTRYNTSNTHCTLELKSCLSTWVCSGSSCLCNSKLPAMVATVSDWLG